MKASLILLVTLFFLSSYSIIAKEIKKDFHKSFDVEEGFTLKLESGDGNVTITPWDKDVLDVEVHYRADYTSYRLGGDDQFNVDFKEQDKTIQIIGRERSHTFIGIHIREQYEYVYKIKAPAYLIVDIIGEDGNITIQNWNGKIKCTIDDGDINLSNIDNKRTDLRTVDGGFIIENLKSDLYIKTDDGDVELTNCEVSRAKISGQDGKITLERCSGTFKIDTDDGHVFAQELKTNILEVKTTDGDVEMELAKSEGIEVDVKTDDGDVILDIADGTSASISIDTDDGRIKMNLPNIKNFEKYRHGASGELYGGNGRIHISTTEGNILLREAI